MRDTKTMLVVIMLGIAAASPAAARAQLNQQKFQSEVRLDAIFARTAGVEAGYGLTVPAGIYVRSGLVAGLGVAGTGRRSNGSLPSV